MLKRFSLVPKGLQSDEDIQFRLASRFINEVIRHLNTCLIFFHIYSLHFCLFFHSGFALPGRRDPRKSGTHYFSSLQSYTPVLVLRQQ